MSFGASLMSTQPDTPAAAQPGANAGSYQTLRARVTAVHDLLREATGISAASRAVTETANAVTVR